MAQPKKSLVEVAKEIISKAMADRSVYDKIAKKEGGIRAMCLPEKLLGH